MRFVRFSLLFAGLSVAGCGSGPKITLCDFIQNEDQTIELICVKADDSVVRKSVSQALTERLLAIPSDDMRSLVEYCGLSSRQKSAVLARASKIEQIIAEHSSGTGN